MKKIKNYNENIANKIFDNIKFNKFDIFKPIFGYKGQLQFDILKDLKSNNDICNENIIYIKNILKSKGLVDFNLKKLINSNNLDTCKYILLPDNENNLSSDKNNTLSINKNNKLSSNENNNDKLSYTTYYDLKMKEKLNNKQNMHSLIYNITNSIIPNIINGDAKANEKVEDIYVMILMLVFHILL